MYDIMEAWIIFIIGENQVIMLFSFWTNNIFKIMGMNTFSIWFPLPLSAAISEATAQVGSWSVGSCA